VIGFLVTVAPKKLASQELDASAEASGPHDFAVRVTRCSSKAHPRPPHPAPRFVTIASRPSEGRDGSKHAGDLGKKESRIFFAKGLDRVWRERGDLPDGSFSFVLRQEIHSRRTDIPPLPACGVETSEARS
jgi:hypothetical protein